MIQTDTEYRNIDTIGIEHLRRTNQDRRQSYRPTFVPPNCPILPFTRNYPKREEDTRQDSLAPDPMSIHGQRGET